MEVYYFDYQKPGCSVTPRFVAVDHKYYGGDLHGYDIADGQYKSFLRNRMNNSPSKVASIGNYSEISLVNRNSLLHMMGYDNSQQVVVDELGITNDKLVDTATNKIGKPVLYVGNDYFIVQNKKFVKYTVQTKTETLFIVVCGDKVEFSDQGGNLLSEIEFARKVLA